MRAPRANPKTPPKVRSASPSPAAGPLLREACGKPARDEHHQKITMPAPTDRANGVPMQREIRASLAANSSAATSAAASRRARTLAMKSAPEPDQTETASTAMTHSRTTSLPRE